MNAPSLRQLVDCGIHETAAAKILELLQRPFANSIDCWQQLTRDVLTPNQPFALHQLLYRIVFSDSNFGDSDFGDSGAPAWIPSEEDIQSANVTALMRDLELSSYQDLHEWSAKNRSQFWERMIQKLNIKFRKPHHQFANLKNAEKPEWLIDARINIAESCFQAPENQIAIVFQSEEEDWRHIWTYGKLNAVSNQVANGLVRAGFKPGDAIAVALPMTAEAVAIYLGIVKAGCVVVSIADSFAANEIQTRLKIANAKAIFTQDEVFRGGKRLSLYSKIIEANAPQAIVLCRHECFLTLRPDDRNWEQFISKNPRFHAVAVSPDSPTNILFSSGTTGEPKAIPWTQTTPIKCAADGHLHQDIHPGDVVAWSTNLGWMMGPWLIYATLINRGTIALYDGAPTTRDYGQFIQTAGVTMLGVVPSLVNTWKTTGCMAGLDWSAIKTFSSTGECSNADDMLYLMSLAGYKPIVEYCGGTEIGGAYITGTRIQSCIPATFTTPALGLDFVILDETDRPSTEGEAFIISPSIGLSTTLLNKDHHQVYFADIPTLSESDVFLRRHGDRIERLPNGYYRAQGRHDDTMNLGGIKVSSAEIERVLNSLEAVAEVAAIAVPPAEGGPCQLVIYTVPVPGFAVTAIELKSQMQNTIRQQLNPLFKIHDVVIVEALPRTASQKVMRRVIRDRYRSVGQKTLMR
ncbi:AMP-binding protein [Leptolyngbya ohadii]|uniref:AMP-binding protein n=1 Tax=Leptolyngbya ohadii TaxID=1962290 RepID=UPI000B599BCB|nr:AMP-binding protein [Leptolyngbya ohadii]